MSYTSVTYRVRPARPEAHLYEVLLTVVEPHPEGQILSLPAWTPGSYMIRDFARNIVSLRARCGQRELEVRKRDKQTWHCPPCDGPLEVIYEVYAWELTVRTAHLDTTHAYFNGACLFLQVHGREEEPCRVEILPPEGDAYWLWQVATTLTEDGAERYGFGLYRAADYEELLDHPVEIGTPTLADFEACGVRHEVAVTGRHNADLERLTDDLRRLCEHHIRFFGEPAPMERYLFLVTAVGDGYGGLEHRSSTSLICKRDDLPLAGQNRVDEGYRDFLGLCSHEYFHTWNIKRIRPARFIPYDLGREVHTTLLWAFEGITSYYDDLALVRCGLIEPESYLELLGRNITRVLRGSGRFRQSVAESSFDAWTKFYKQDENAPNAVVSYYAKGALVALCLDLLIRDETGDRYSLDDVMRALWNDYGKADTGLGEEEFEAMIADVTGVDVLPFLEEAVRGTSDLPLEELLAAVGIEMHLRPTESESDKGGRAGDVDEGELVRRGALGARTGEDPLGARLLNVFDGGAAQQAGLAAGDVVVAVDGLRATHANLRRQLASRLPGAVSTLHAFRRDELLQFEVTLQSPPEDTCYLLMQEEADEVTLRHRMSWLGIPSD